MGKNGNTDFDNWDFELIAEDMNGNSLNVTLSDTAKTAGENTYTQKTFTMTLPFNASPEDIKLGWNFAKDKDYPYVGDVQVYLNGYSRDLRGSKGNDYISFLTNGGCLGDAAALTDLAAKALYEYDTDNKYGFTTKELYKDYSFNYNEFDLTVYSREYVYEVYKVRIVHEPRFTYEGAQIRTEGVQGLRFKFSIPVGYYDILEKPADNTDTGDGFGSVVIPLGMLNEELSKETSGAAIVPAVKLFDVTEQRVYYTVCITGISTDKYKEKFVFIPYATSDGVTHYGECATSLSLYDVAVLIYNSQEASYEIKNYVYENILTVTELDIYPKQ